MRGKKGAQATLRRERQTDERVANLEATLRRERTESNQREAALKAEVQRVSGALVSDVDRRAASAIEDAQRRADEHVAAARRDAQEAASAVLALLDEKGDWRMDPEGYDELSRLTGKPYVELCDASDLPRDVRRRASPTDLTYMAQESRAKGGRGRYVRCSLCLGSGRVHPALVEDKAQ